MKQYNLTLINFVYDETQSKIYLLTWCIPKVFSSDDIPLVNYLLWPIHIHDRFMNKFVLESPVSLLSLDYKEENKSTYSKNGQLSLKNNRIFVSIEENVSILQQNKIIYKFECKGILTQNAIDIADLCILTEFGVIDLIQVVELTDDRSSASKSSEHISQDSSSIFDSEEAEPELNYANMVLGFFRNKRIPSNRILASIPEQSVVRASELLIDSTPTSGSLFIEASNSNFSEKFSILILRSLQKKLDEHFKFINFLFENELWERLDDKQRREIMEDGEKTFACIKLRELQSILAKSSQDSVVNEAMRKCCELRGFESSRCDVENFYITVSRMHEIITQIQVVTNIERVKSEHKFRNISIVNRVYQAIIEGIQEYRTLLTKINLGYTGSCWLVDDPDRIVHSFFEQFKISAENLSACKENAVAQILNELYEIADFLFSILQDLQVKEHSTFNKHQFEEKRDLIISTFKQIKDIGDISPTNFALTLAEKYKDYKHLIKLTEEKYPTEEERTAKYSSYLRRYDTFPLYLFTYLRDTAKYHQLLSNYDWNRLYSSQLAAVVEGDANLRWLYYIQVNNLENVQQALAELSDDTAQNILQRGDLAITKNRLSLLKLASVANGDLESTQNASYYLKLAYYQEQISTGLAIDNPNYESAKEPFKGAVDLMVQIYKGIPSDPKVISEKQDVLLDRLNAACDIYHEWSERETECDEQTRFDVLLNIYTAAFYVSPQLLHLVRQTDSNNEQDLIADSILFRLAQKNSEKRSAATEQLRERLTNFFSETFSERHAQVVQAVFDLLADQ